MLPNTKLPMRFAGLAALCVSAVLIMSGCNLTAATSTSPKLGDSWYIQLSGTIDMSQAAKVYDVDGFNTDAATVSSLHAKGKLVVCYVDLGSIENYRADYGDFAKSTLSNANPQWPDEQWLDILRMDTVGPTGKTPRQILGARLDMCKAKGFDAVDPDMVEVYAASGVSFTPAERKITYDDQLTFNRWIAAQSHQRGMSVGLKGDIDQAKDLVGDFDFAVNEQCHQYNECDLLTPFVSAGKSVLNIEYGAYSDAAFTSKVCPDAASRKFFSVHKKLSLNAWTQNC